MSSFSERVSALSPCILNDKLWEGLKAPLPEGTEPSAALLKKLESAELEAKRLFPVIMPELKNRYLVFQKIENDPRFQQASPEKDKQLLRSFNSLKKKWAKFEWDEEKQEFIKGRPNNGDMNSINLGPLLEAWNKFLGGGEPATASAVTGSPPEFTDSEILVADWESFKIRIGKRFESHLQFILSKPDLADKLKQIQTIMKSVDPTREEPVNVEELNQLANEIIPHLPSSSPVSVPRASKTCTEKGCKSKAVRGDHCRDCSTQYWTEGPIIKDLRIREAEYKRRVGDQEFLNYKHKYRNEFDEVVTEYENRDGDKGYADLVALYKKMDKLLPKMGTFEVPKLATEVSSSKRKKREESYEELSSDPMEESDEEEEEEEEDEEEDEEEEEEEEEEDYRPKKNKKKRQSEPSLDDVLALFAPRDALIAELYEADDLESAWKRVKAELTKTYRVEFIERNTGEPPRQWKLLLREAKVFDSREKAEAFAAEWFAFFPGATHSYQIIEE